MNVESVAHLFLRKETMKFIFHLFISSKIYTSVPSVRQVFRECFLTRHVAEVHERRKQFKFEFCKRHFSRRNLLQNHVDAVHEGKRPFKYEVCNFTCAQRGSLKIHVAGVHEGKMKK